MAKGKLPRITLFEVNAAGSQQGELKAYRGALYINDSAAVKIEIVADDDDAEHIAGLIIRALRTGNLGEGEVIIVPIEQHFRSRVGGRGGPMPNRLVEHVVSQLTRNGRSLGYYLKILRRKFHETGRSDY